MGRFILLTGLCAVLMGIAAPWARAQQVFVGGDPNTMLMDVYLRDADIPEALSALFNTTDGRCQLKLDPSVVGRVSRLQLTATPFETALNAVLGDEFSYRKTQVGQTFLYTITGRNAAAPKPAAAPAFNAPPADTAVAPSTSNIGSGNGAKPKSGFPMLSYFTNKGNNANGGGKPAANGGAVGDASAGDQAADELSVVKMIGVNYLDLPSLCQALGGSTIMLFNQAGNMGGGGNNMGGGFNNGGLNNGMNNGMNNGFNNGMNNNQGLMNNNNMMNNNNRMNNNQGLMNNNNMNNMNRQVGG